MITAGCADPHYGYIDPMPYSLGCLLLKIPVQLLSGPAR